jgi:uncharacterized Zn finger protein (UPF0148 family)
MIHYECCSICEERRIGIIDIDGIVFCSVCERRELDHNIRMTEKQMQRLEK